MAFTLAEVLITLGIIGVVAALTLPTLVQKYKEQVTVNKLIKTYSLLEQAFMQAISDNGTIDNWCSNDELWNVCSEKIFYTVKPYIKNLKECKRKSCFAPSYNSRFADNRRSMNYDNSIALPDGTVFVLIAASGSMSKNSWCQGDKNSSGSIRYFGSCGYVYVDINGSKLPNTIDTDLFQFTIFRDGVAPSATQKDTVWTMSFDNQCLGNAYYSGFGCTAWVVVNKNLDYLRCPEKLGWNKASSCK